jgi:hypothetical protein
LASRFIFSAARSPVTIHYQLTVTKSLGYASQASKSAHSVGEVAEWSKAQHWKCCVGQLTVGSNPTFSVTSQKASDSLSLKLFAFTHPESCDVTKLIADPR